MPNAEYVHAMARYNLWQNDNLVSAATRIGPAARQRDRGAFFGSIEKTFFHVYWADRIWMSRFTDLAAPAGGLAESTAFEGDWDDFRKARAASDQLIRSWAASVDPDWFAGELSWFSGAAGRNMSRPKPLVVMQLFNHQTHHRGQIHAMLTAAGEKPGATDIAFMPAEDP